MAKYYCEYCQNYLTQDSPKVINGHLRGKQHILNYISYYKNISLRNNQRITRKDEVDVTKVPGTLSSLPPPPPLR